MKRRTLRGDMEDEEERDFDRASSHRTGRPDRTDEMSVIEGKPKWKAKRWRPRRDRGVV